MRSFTEQVHILQRRRGKLWLSILGSCFIAMQLQAATLNVTNYGARGDAVNIQVNTVSNSFVVTTTNHLSSADVGKVITIFGAGSRLSNTNAFQDFVAVINSVSNQTNLTLSRAAGCAANAAQAVYGTYSTTAFQTAIDAAKTGDTIQVPAGRYLVIPPVYDTNWLATSRQGEAALNIKKGGFQLLGDDKATTILLGNGAWQFTGGSNYVVYRGTIISFGGSVTNDGPLSFQNLTFDGGVSNGAQSYKGWPADNNGNGWDWTHGATITVGPAPWNTNKSFVSCNFIHWRGEILKDTIGFPTLPGVANVTNCLFMDGNASGINFNYGGTISGCTFSNLNLAMEMYQGYRQTALTFESNLAVNCVDGITVVGAHSNQINQAFIIRNNTFDNTGWAVIFGPAQNLFISNNVMRNLGSAILTSAFAYQSIYPTINSNILISSNYFSNCAQCFYNGGCGQDTLVNLIMSNNVADGISGAFANGTGGCQTNILFVNNIVTHGNAGLDSSSLGGQYYIDGISNQFPRHKYDDFAGRTNLVSYAYGRQQYINATHAGSVYRLDDTFPAMIPANVQLVISNASGTTLMLYPSATFSLPAVTMTNGYSATCTWTNGVWQVVGTQDVLMPPTNLRVVGP